MRIQLVGGATLAPLLKVKYYWTEGQGECHVCIYLYILLEAHIFMNTKRAHSASLEYCFQPTLVMTCSQSKRAKENV